VSPPAYNRSAPTGFALRRPRDAGRLYEKTTSGRVRDARQELQSSGLQRPKDEHEFLIRMGRPAVMEVVAWAAIAVKTPTISTASGG